MRTTASSRQQGMTLIESLVSIVIFSLGILGLIGLQASAINLSTDARHRADAAFLADQMIGLITISDATTLSTFAHKPSGSVCASSGSASTNTKVTGWVTQANSVFQGASPQQQIKVDTSNNVVTVGLCWQQKDGDQHSHVVTTQIQWQ